MSIADYNTNPDSNLLISGINIAEGCPASGINDAIRQMMADVKTEANNTVHLSGAETISGKKTFTAAITASGGVTGNVTGDCTGNAATSSACSGNAASATKLQTARKINGVSFNGTADISVTLTQAQKDAILSENFTIIYPNGGTAKNPANVAVNSRYVMDNPFAGYHVYCEAEVLYNNKWFFADFCGNPGSGTNSWGVKASSYDGGIVIVTGKTGVFMSTNNMSGTPYPNEDVRIALPCRVKVWKIGKV